mmetsp:Transcript_33675/g.111385  ORF Transcript_33675/g.111385 Transcript_33675/m.111385 type:complete len:221 (-) Transcript_33675:497-1159(-)
MISDLASSSNTSSTSLENTYVLPFGSGIPSGALPSSELPPVTRGGMVGLYSRGSMPAWEAGSALTNSLARSSTGVQPPSKEAARLARSAGATQQVASAATGLTMYCRVLGGGVCGLTMPSVWVQVGQKSQTWCPLSPSRASVSRQPPEPITMPSPFSLIRVPLNWHVPARGGDLVAVAHKRGGATVGHVKRAREPDVVILAGGPQPDQLKILRRRGEHVV